MRFAYLTTDEVNQALAVEMAANCGVILCPFAPKDGSSYGTFDAVLCDWDSWPENGRSSFLSELKHGALPKRLAVHGYNLTSDEVTSLLTKGVIVYRMLKAEAFRLLSEPDNLVIPETATVIIDQSAVDTAPLGKYSSPEPAPTAPKARVRALSESSVEAR